MADLLHLPPLMLGNLTKKEILHKSSIIATLLLSAKELCFDIYFVLTIKIYCVNFRFLL